MVFGNNMYKGKTFQIDTGELPEGMPFEGKTFTIPKEPVLPLPTWKPTTFDVKTTWEETLLHYPGALRDTLKSAIGLSDENVQNLIEHNPAWDNMSIGEQLKSFWSEYGKNLYKFATSIPKAAIQFLATPSIGAVEEIYNVSLGEVKLPTKIGDWIGPLTGTRTQWEQYQAAGYTKGEAIGLVTAQQMTRSLPFVAVFGTPAYIEALIRRPTVETTYELKFETKETTIGKSLIKTQKGKMVEIPRGLSKMGNKQWVAGIKGQPNKYVVVSENPYSPTGYSSKGFTVTDPVLQIQNKAFVKNIIPSPEGLDFPTQNLALPGLTHWIGSNPVVSHTKFVEEAFNRILPTITKKVPLPLPKLPPPVVVPPVETTETQVTQNANYKAVKAKLETQGSASLTNKELDTLSKGVQEIITADGVKEITSEDITTQKIMEMYSGVPLNKIADVPISVRGTKMRLIDALGKEIVRYHGLTPEIKDLLIRLEGETDLRKEDLTRFFMTQFPISKEQAVYLMNHQEKPDIYPITPELELHAKQVEELVKLSRTLQEERGLQKTFFPQSFINQANKKIEQYIKILQTAKKPTTQQKYIQLIEDMESYIEFLEGLRYTPHLYLFNQEIERNFLKLMPEGKITSRFRDALTRLKGRKIATLDEAKELGLIPEEDVRIVLATHFEYLFRKIAIHDMIEELRKNPLAVLKEADAPKNWDSVAIGQLSGYKVNPLLTSAIEDFALNYKTSIIGRGYDAVNYLGKAIVFYNPIILPFWNVFQGFAAGSVKIHRPFYTLSLFNQAAKEVVNKGELYREGVKGMLYTTPKVGYYSAPVEQTMRMLTNQIEKDYPGWKKAVEKITAKPVDWKTFLVIPDLYTTNWQMTWWYDRVQRTMTLIHCLNRGMEMPTAIEYAKTFHANYNLFTKRSKKWLNRLFLVPTYKTNMIIRMPSYIAKKTFELAKGITAGKPPTPEQKAALGAIWRIIVLVAGTIGFAAWRGYYLREGYRLVKRLKEPDVSPEGKILMERVITLPGPFFEIPKLIQRLKTGPKGFYMYMAKVPQIAWGWARNVRWMGDPYYDEGASPEVQIRQILIGTLKDYIAPVDRISMMTDEETEAIDNILSTIGIATYRRGGTERRIMWQIFDEKTKLIDYLKKPDISIEDKNKAMEHYQSTVEKLIVELEDYMETYK